MHRKGKVFLVEKAFVEFGVLLTLFGFLAVHICSAFSNEASLTSQSEDEQMKAIKKNAHIAAEQKRRNNIKTGIDELQAIVPTCKKGSSKNSTKQSKATVLRKAVDYISHLIKEKTSLVEEVKNLREEVAALRSVISKYQQMGPPDENEFQNAAEAHMRAQNIGDNIKFYLVCINDR